MPTPQGRIQILDFTKKDQCLAPVPTNGLALPGLGHTATQQAAQQTEAATTAAKPGEPLALPAPPIPDQEGQDQKNDDGIAQVTEKSLEDHEAEAMAALQKNKMPNNTKSKGFKRLSAAMPKQEAQPTKMEPKDAQTSQHKRHRQNDPGHVQIKAADLGKYGCKRCRGNL